MSVRCIRLPDWKVFRNLLAKRGHDFWLSGAAHLGEAQLRERLPAMRVEDVKVVDAFTHCFFTSSKDIASEVNALIDEFGLGLRKKRAHKEAHPVPGCIYCLVNFDGPSLLHAQRSHLPGDDRRLSTEERIRRSHLQFEVVDEERIAEEIRQHPRSFWLTGIGGTDVELCKKRAVCLTAGGEPIVKRFSHCLLVPSGVCGKDISRLSGPHGLGLRRRRIKSMEGPGYIVLLLAAEEAPTEIQQSRDAAAAPLPVAEAPTEIQRSRDAAAAPLPVAEAMTPDVKRRRRFRTSWTPSPPPSVPGGLASRIEPAEKISTDTGPLQA